MKTHRVQKMRDKAEIINVAVPAAILFLVVLFCVCLLAGCCHQQTHVTFPDQTTVDCNSTTLFKDMHIVYKPDPQDPNRMMVEVTGGSSHPIDVFLAGLAVVFGTLL